MRSQTRQFLRGIARDAALVALCVATIAAHLVCAYLLGWGALALLTEQASDWGDRMLVGAIVYCVAFPVVRTLLEWLDDRYWDAVLNEPDRG